MRRRVTGAAGIFAAAVLCSAAAGTQTGIDFRAMPVGCQWKTAFAHGPTLNSTFLGWKQDRYVVRTTAFAKPQKYVKTTYYNRDGYMVHRDWAGGHWESYRPHSCFDTAGICRMHYTNSDGRSFEIKDRTIIRGGTYTSIPGSQTGRAIRPRPSASGRSASWC